MGQVKFSVRACSTFGIVLGAEDTMTKRGQLTLLSGNVIMPAN